VTDVLISRNRNLSGPDSVQLVSCDQETIFGDGSRTNPIRVGSGTGEVSFQADVGVEVVVGTTLATTGSFPSVGIVQATPAHADDEPTYTRVIGIVTTLVPAGLRQEATVQATGRLTLTAAQWDEVTGQSGGLAPGSPYYLSNTPGEITTTPPGELSSVVLLVGIALNATTLLLGTFNMFQENGGT
jgi:hypothetical protein